MAEEKTYVFGQDGGSASVPAWLAAMNGNGGFGSFNSLADLFGFAIIASMFGWGNNGFGGGIGGGNAAGFLANQLNNDSGRELIMNAVTSLKSSAASVALLVTTEPVKTYPLVGVYISSESR